MGADNVLALAKRKECPVLIASTSEVYGDPLEHPQKESYWGHVNPIGPRGCYDESKRYQEALAMAYHRVHEVSIRIVRIFNTYGPRMRTDDGRVVPNFCLQALRGEPLTVYGLGRQTRSFCYVDDLVEGLLRLISVAHHEPVNLGNPSERTILEFAKTIISLTGSKSAITYQPLPLDDPKVRCPDIGKARQLLGWKPVVTLEEGLRKTIEHFRHELEAELHGAGSGGAAVKMQIANQRIDSLQLAIRARGHSIEYAGNSALARDALRACLKTVTSVTFPDD